ncbi:MAG: YeiH family protein [Steroidobacteraceae bacterium]
MRAILPGFAFAVALAAAAKGLSFASGGMVSAILCAIALGILWRNLVGLGAWAEPGLEFTGQTLLRIGIALIGLRLTWLVLTETGMTALPVVIACISVALMVTVGFGKLLGVGAGIRRLLAAGTAICGCTAIIAIAPLVRAQKADIGIAITCVVVFGSIAMVGYPWLAGAVFGTEAMPAGMFFGASIHDTSQVVGAALIYADQYDSPDAVAIAGFTKFLRTFGLLLLVPAAAMWMARSESETAASEPRDLRRRAVPWFVIVFILLAGVRAAADYLAGGAEWQGLWQQTLAGAQRVSELLLLCGMAAVGLGITFSHLREAGWRPVLLSFLAALVTGACALGMIHFL